MRTLLVGFDSAWTANNRGALVGVVQNLAMDYLELGPPQCATYAEAEAVIEKWRSEFTPTATIVFLDQPTIVKNRNGQRPFENVAGSAIGRRYGGMQPANRSRLAMFGDGAPVWSFLDRFGGALNVLEERWTGGVVETYPALAIIALGWTLPDRAGRPTGRLPKYNPAVRMKFSVSDWQHVCGLVSQEFARKKLSQLAEWASQVSNLATIKKADQDRIDACICLIAGIRMIEGQDCLVVGDFRSGCMVVPDDKRLRKELKERCVRICQDPERFVQKFNW